MSQGAMLRRISSMPGGRILAFLVGVAAGGGALLVALAPWIPAASAAPAYPPTPPCALSVRAATSNVSGKVLLTGTGLGPTERVDVVWRPNSVWLAAVRTDDTGAFATVVGVPAAGLAAGGEIAATSASASCVHPVPPTSPPAHSGPGSGPGGAGSGGTGSRAAGSGGAGSRAAGSGGAGSGGTGSGGAGSDGASAGTGSAPAGSGDGSANGSGRPTTGASDRAGTGAGGPSRAAPSEPAQARSAGNSALNLPLGTILAVATALVIIGAGAVVFLTRRSSS